MALSTSDYIQTAAVVATLVGAVVTVSFRDARQDAAIEALERQLSDQQRLRAHGERLIWDRLRLLPDPR